MNNEPSWAGRKVLVTGASGFIGSNLCRYLCLMGADVHATSRVGRFTSSDGPKWWQGDVADLRTARNIIFSVKPDLVFHLSGMVVARPDLELVLPTFHSLLTSTVNVLTVSAEAGCSRIVLAGSMTEPDPVKGEFTPGSPYAAAKWASSAYGRMFHRLYQTPCVIVRTFMTYGPTQDPTKLIPSVTLAFLNGEPPKLSSGQYRADWIYIDDVVEGLIRAALTPQMEGGTIDLGTGVLTSVREIGQCIKVVIGTDIEPVYGALPDRPFEQVRVADLSETTARLGWKPKISLEEGLRQTVEWYRTQSETKGQSKALGSSVLQ